MLTVEQIEFLLRELGYMTVAEFHDGGFRVQQRESGYRDGLGGKCQAALSIMLEAKHRMAKAKA